MTENDYHMYGLIGEILSVGHFKIEHTPSISLALQFLVEARTKYESDNPADTKEEDQEAADQADGQDHGSNDTGHVPEA